ncbi:keratin, type I cytoskeletal 18-like [Esox lucius]|uniref:keratin, type I cytoskeletal 18-like n=1 Tax=Esox lucius TaxID=8010 RepID=UPI001476DA58|nr:keratin, type I cytoskeletal 18-like [Esox lucius]
MSKNSAITVFGGAGGRGSRMSVASLEGLRSAMRSSDPENSKDSSQPLRNAPDDKKEMKGLNDRLSGYLGRVRKLEKDNKDLEDEIQDILDKRGDPNARDWDEVEKPLSDLRKKLHRMTLENARLLQQRDNSKLAHDDFKNKLENEIKTRKSLKHDLIGLKKMVDDTNLNRMQLESQIKSVKEELDVLKQDHKDEVDKLCQKIHNSNITVEFDSRDSNLGESLKRMRAQYEKLVEKNLKDTDAWYQRKFESIKVEVVQNTEAVELSRNELKELRKQKQRLEIDIQAMLRTISSLEETRQEKNARYSHEMTRVNKILLQLEAELGKVKTQVEKQVDDYQELLHVKMKLEAEIENYRRLIQGIAPDDSLEFSLAQPVNRGL